MILKDVLYTRFCVLKDYLRESRWDLYFFWGRIKHLPKRLRRAASYARRGFSSEDFDYAYLLGDIEFKLRRMAHEHNECEHLEDKTAADQMENLADMLKMLRDDAWFVEREYLILQAKYLVHGQIPTLLNSGKNLKPRPEWSADIHKVYELSDRRQDELERAAYKFFRKCVKGWWT